MEQKCWAHVKAAESWWDRQQRTREKEMDQQARMIRNDGIIIIIIVLIITVMIIPIMSTRRTSTATTASFHKIHNI